MTIVPPLVPPLLETLVQRKDLRRIWNRLVFTCANPASYASLPLFASSHSIMEVTGADRYMAEKLPQYEADVEAQAAGRAPYNLSVSLAVLRLYQPHPTLAKNGIIAKILLKALTQLPAPDYKICSHVLTEKLQAEEPVATIALLAQHLETMRLSDFWALANSCKDVLATVPGFLDAARRFILHTVGNGCQRVRLSVLADSLQLGDAELRQLLAQQEKDAGWKVAGDLVMLPRNSLNTAAPKLSKGTISFEAVAPALFGMVH